MRRILAGLVLFVGLAAASYGFASSFNVNGNAGQDGQADLSTGNVVVASCNGNVEVDIDGQFANGDYYVLDVDIDANEDCQGDAVQVTLTDENGVALPNGTLNGELDPAGDAHLTPDSPILVADVDQAFVLIDGAGENAP